MMDATPIALVVITVLAPGAAFAVISLFFMRSKVLARYTSLLFIGVSAVCSSLALLKVNSPEYHLEWTIPWFYSLGGIFEIGVLVDPLSLVMLWVVAMISFFVQMYSFSYMEHDESQSRFFSFISLFCFAMMGFTIAPNMLQAYCCWELVGLGSYLLIGFWYQLPSAAVAGRKAFVMTRLGDLGFFAAILIIFKIFGTLNFGTLAGSAQASGWLSPLLGGDVAMWVSIGLFMAVAGKSAQFPLYGWLPDAMEGPTPVSALIHAATMVAAGVYLLARTSFLLSFGSVFTANAWHVLAIIAMLTVLMSGAVAIVQSDIKRVLAYSTISQLGYMVVGLGTGAAVAAMMHLFTHAFFKALLFLTAGAFIHAAHSNSITDIARAGGRKMTLAVISIVVGSLALCGIFPFSGFFSKDAILEHVLAEGHIGLFVFGMLGVFITAYYTFRMVFLLLSVKPDKPDANPRTGSWMVPTLTVLTIMSVVSAFIWNHYLPDWFHVHHGGQDAHSAVLITTIVSTSLALLGIFFAARIFFFRKMNDPMGSLPRIATTLKEKWYLDHAYWWVVHSVYFPITDFLSKFELAAIKGAINGFGRGCMLVARGLSAAQTGLIQQYLGVLFAVIAVMVFILLSV